jgi:GH18 family chitinase
MLESSFAENSENLTLSIAVSADRAVIESSYQIEAINTLVDFVNLVAYDVIFRYFIINVFLRLNQVKKFKL